MMGGHEGIADWLINYGTMPKADELRRKVTNHRKSKNEIGSFVWCSKTRSFVWQLANSEKELPWSRICELGWRIAALNHYNEGGVRKVFCVVVAAESHRCVQHEGPDGWGFWDELEKKCVGAAYDLV